MSVKTSIVAATLISLLHSAPDSIEDFLSDLDTSSTTSTISNKHDVTETRSRDRVVLPPDLSSSNNSSSNDTKETSTSTTTRESNSNSTDNPSIDPDELSKWEALAECESGGDWSIDTGNGFYGGLQFTPQTWAGSGGTKYAPQANQATKEQQIDIAKKVQQSQGWGAWPACTSKLGYR